MPKKIKFESFKYRFLIAAQNASLLPAVQGQPSWQDFVRDLLFDYENGRITVKWTVPVPGTISFPLDEAHFFARGDDVAHIKSGQVMPSSGASDPVRVENEMYFRKVVLATAQAAGYGDSVHQPAGDAKRLADERAFHDAWADSEHVENIDVRAVNEACTAPEMRYITQRLGNVNGKKLLDVGCGLGEASIYFALLGANVTSTDLSQGMLDATCRLAKANGVSVTPHLASAEDMQLPADAQFDIIYAGNLLHHVDIDQTLARIKPHLAADGIFVAWEPLAYNPIINVYRALATEVRTSDEHPLKWNDIQIFKKNFRAIETRYFWLSTLLIFMIMALIQFRNPNKERFWKVVVKEEAKWRWLYLPLEKLDKVLLKIFPPLRLLCWNVVLVGKK